MRLLATSLFIFPFLLQHEANHALAFCPVALKKSPGRIPHHHSELNLRPQTVKVETATRLYSDESSKNGVRISRGNGIFPSRRSIVMVSSSALIASIVPTAAFAKERKCTDIESCREIGELKDQETLRRNPITQLPSGVSYKVLRPGITKGDATVKEGSTIDLIYSISEASGPYMYSQGFGYEKIKSDLDGGKLQSDLGLDSLRVVLGRKDVPLGIEQALMGMNRGERRRVVLPPSVGFETSGWQPEPTTRRGKATIVNYKSILKGRGSSQPPFPAPTIWDVEVLRIRKQD